MIFDASDRAFKGNEIEAKVSAYDDNENHIFTGMVVLNRTASKQEYANNLHAAYPDQAKDIDIIGALNKLHKAIKKELASNRNGNGHQPEQPAAAKIPEIPKDAWYGLFSDYRDIMGPTTEASDAFHYAVFCQVLGCTIGRSLRVYHAGDIYPNFYIALVGRSGLSRKSISAGRGIDILNSLHHQEDDDTGAKPDFRIVTGIRSVEGLMEELQGKRKVRLIQIDELLSLLSKAKQDGSSNIVPQLTELYNCPNRHNPTIKTPSFQVVEPFVSILANTTHSWLTASLTVSHIYGGFANRWMYFIGNPKKPNYRPPKINQEKKSALLCSIKDIRKWAKEEVPNGEIQISQKADKLFKKYYDGFYHRCMPDGILPTLIVRVQDFIWKIALLYAAIDRSIEIKNTHLEAAIAVGDYLEACVFHTFRTFAMSKAKMEEEKILEYLQSIKESISERDLYRNLNLSSRDLGSKMQNLATIGLINITEKKMGNNKTVTFYSAN